MTKAELIKRLQEEMDVSGAQAEACINMLGDIMAAELLGGGEVPLPGVGKIVVTDRAARRGRNPRTGAPIDIPAQKGLKIVISKGLKTSLN